MNSFSVFLMFLFATTVTQNMVLSTGLGSSMMLRIVRHPRDMWLFFALLSGFSVATVTIAYPLDQLIGIGFWAKLLRPLMITGIAILLYLLASLISRKANPAFYARISHQLPLAAFNNLVIGVALISNHSFALPLYAAVALAIGCCGGFVVLSLLVSEGLQRLDNPAVPAAFRGLPVTLLYVGLLALAILGFSSPVSLI